MGRCVTLEVNQINADEELVPRGCFLYLKKVVFNTMLTCDLLGIPIAIKNILEDLAADWLQEV